MKNAEAAVLLILGLLFFFRKEATATVEEITESNLNDMTNANDFRSNSLAAGSLGLRNNNPFNLRKSLIPWKGIAGDDGAFEIFENIYYGLRAGMKNIRSDFKKGWTLAQVIEDNSPAFENPLTQYINNVSTAAGVSPDAKLEDFTREQLRAMLWATVKFEISNHYAAMISGAEFDAAFNNVFPL